MAALQRHDEQLQALERRQDVAHAAFNTVQMNTINSIDRTIRETHDVNTRLGATEMSMVRAGSLRHGSTERGRSEELEVWDVDVPKPSSPGLSLYDALSHLQL